MLTWKKLPGDIPADGDTVWIRVNYYFSDPFLAVFDLTTSIFTSVVNSIAYPAWVVARWATGLGPELIQNGSFDSSAYWYTSAPWSITGGKALFNATSTNVIGQALTITAGKRYILSFDIGDLATTSRVRFLGDAYTALWAGDWGIRTARAAGHYSIEVTALVSSTYLFFEGTQSDPTFSWDNVSLREILS